MKKLVVSYLVATVPVLLIALAASAWYQYATWLVEL